MIPRYFILWLFLNTMYVPFNKNISFINRKSKNRSKIFLMYNISYVKKRKQIILYKIFITILLYYTIILLYILSYYYTYYIYGHALTDTDDSLLKSFHFNFQYSKKIIITTISSSSLFLPSYSYYALEKTLGH